MPTAKAPPASPTNKPASKNCQYCVASDSSQMPGVQTSSNTVMVRRPPQRSLQMPSGTRTKAPARMGVAISRPKRVSESTSASRMGSPITPNIIHAMKHTVNARVLASKDDQAWRWCLRVSGMAGSGRVVCAQRLRTHTFAL